MSRVRPWCFATTLGALSLVAPGCDQPTGSTKPRSRAAEAVGVASPEPEAVAPAAPAPAPAARRPILGQTTGVIKDAAVETKAGGVVTPPKIVAKDPITLPGNAYVAMVGSIAIQDMRHAVDLYYGETGEYPKTYAEFKEKVVDPNGIRLPLLPSYQEYGYDAPSHSLIILEYPDRKARPN